MLPTIAFCILPGRSGEAEAVAHGHGRTHRLSAVGLSWERPPGQRAAARGMTRQDSALLKINIDAGHAALALQYADRAGIRLCASMRGRPRRPALPVAS